MKSHRPITLALTAIFTIAITDASGQSERNAPSSPFGMTEVLEKHALWLASKGAKGARADLRQISLEGDTGGKTVIMVGRTALNGVDLRQADLRFARLRNVDFTSANLEDARFDGSNLRWATLNDSNLRRANFTGANLQAAYLRNANLDQAVFDKADLSGADLSGSKCLAKSQLATAIIDEQTKLPDFENCNSQPDKN